MQYKPNVFTETAVLTETTYLTETIQSSCPGWTTEAHHNVAVSTQT